MDLIETRTGVEAPEEITDGVLHAQEAEDVAAQAEVVGSEQEDAISAQEDAASELDAVVPEEDAGLQEPAGSTADLEDVVSAEGSMPSVEEAAPSEPEETPTSQEETTSEAEDEIPEPESSDSKPKAVAVEEDKAQMGGHPMEDWDYQEPKRGQVRIGEILSIQEQEIIVDVGAKRDGIVPSTDLQRLDAESLAELAVGQEVPVYVLRTEDQDGNLLVSLNMARQEKAWLRAKELSESGEVIEDEVIGYNKGGLVVPVGEIRGFVPASQVPGFPHGLSQEDRIQRLSDMVGKKLQVKVIEINRRKRRLILSATAAQRLWRKQQRERLLAELREGEVRSGTVSSLCAFGAFVDLGGADGLVHLSELSWRRVRHPREVLKVGDEIEVYVLRLDQEKNRIGLSLKRLQPEPWALVEDKYELGQLVEGVVTNVVDFGAFAEIEDGVEGLIHVSELADGQISHPRDVVKKGDLLLLRIIRIDTRRKRLGLSLKRVLESEWAEWAAALAVAEAEAAEAAAAEAAEAAAVEAAKAEAAAAEAAVAEAAEAETAEAGEVVSEEAEEAVEAEAVAGETAAGAEDVEEAVAEEIVVAEAAVVEAAEEEAVAADDAAAEAEDAEVEVTEAAVAEAEDAEVEVAEVAVVEAEVAEAAVAEAEVAEVEVAEAAVAEAEVAEVEVAEAAVVEAAVVEAEVAEAAIVEAAAQGAVAEETVAEEGAAEEAGAEEAIAADAAVSEAVVEEVEEAEVAEELEAVASTDGSEVVAEAATAEVAAAEAAEVEDVEESEAEDETIEDPEHDIVDA